MYLLLLLRYFVLQNVATKMKTKPIGVRFDEDDLAMLKPDGYWYCSEGGVLFVFWMEAAYVHGDYVAKCYAAECSYTC